MGVVYTNNVSKVTIDASTASNLKDGLVNALSARGWTQIGPPGATIRFLAQPSDGDTFTTGGSGATAKTYTFKTTLTGGADGQIKIGATLADTVSNLVAGVNLGAGSGTAYSSGMTANPRVSASIHPTVTTSMRVLATITVRTVFAASPSSLFDNIPSFVAQGTQLMVSQATPSGLKVGVLIANAGITIAGVGPVGSVIVQAISADYQNSDVGVAHLATQGFSGPMLGADTGKTLIAICGPYFFHILRLTDSGSRGNNMSVGTLSTPTQLAPGAITNITNASPAVVTQAAHGYGNGSNVFISLCNMPTARGTKTITVIDTNSYSLNGTDTTGDPAFSGSALAAGNNTTNGQQTGEAFLQIPDFIEGNAGYSNTLRNFLRYGGGSSCYFCYNGVLWTPSTGSYISGSWRMQLPAGSGSRAVNERVMWSNGYGLGTEPLMMWGLTGDTSLNPRTIGQIPDAMVYNDALNIDLTNPDIPTFDGHNWFNFTDNNTEVPGGSLMVVVP